MKRWRDLLHNEEGFTFLEAVMSSAISALIMGALVVIIFQINGATRVQSSTLEANQQIQGAASMLNRDIVSARSGVVSDTVMALYVPKYTFGQDTAAVTKTVTYWLRDDERDADKKELARYDDDSGTTIVLARHLDGVDFGPDGTLSAAPRITVSTSFTNALSKQATVRNAAMVFHRRPAD